MSPTIQAPLDMMEAIANVRLPVVTDRRLQNLMDRNTNGQLTEEDRAELADLTKWSEEISLLRAAALHLLGRKPQ